MMALELIALRKNFGPSDIIRGVNLAVAAGQRVALIGPNGAGKSTLFNLVSGKLAPSSGQILLHGQPIQGHKPFQVHRAGLARSFQVSNLFGQLSVWDNLRCSVLGKLGYANTFWRLLNGLPDATALAQAAMVQVRLDGKRDVLAAHLSYAEQRQLELGITIAGGPSVILLDEPTAGMAAAESARFVQLIREVSVDKTLLVVEHDMGVVFSLADQIAVLAAGQVVALGPPAAIRANPLVQAVYGGAHAAG
jgi:branched-chain amino acid transport system ATP-binding protein